MGQTLLRELGDIGKRLEQEKTQRCFVQGCCPPSHTAVKHHAPAHECRVRAAGNCQITQVYTQSALSLLSHMPPHVAPAAQKLTRPSGKHGAVNDGVPAHAPGRCARAATSWPR